jgi:hypothetical protein
VNRISASTYASARATTAPRRSCGATAVASGRLGHGRGRSAIGGDPAITQIAASATSSVIDPARRFARVTASNGERSKHRPMISAKAVV